MSRGSSGNTLHALTWQVSEFADMTVAQVHDVMALRSAVFVVEQNCVFQDIDGYDPVAVHVMGFGARPQDDESAPTPLLAYARCFAPGVKMAEASIGRVATPLAARQLGLGHLLIQRSIAVVRQRWGACPIRIGAQMRLGNFYAQHGFVATGQPYMEDGIEHIEMLRAAS